jgi:hypothetical protein
MTARDREVVRPGQAGEPVAQEERGLGEDSAHGTSMTIMVGPAGRAAAHGQDAVE